jgi:hypothetical protein
MSFGYDKLSPHTQRWLVQILLPQAFEFAIADFLENAGGITYLGDDHGYRADENRTWKAEGSGKQCAHGTSTHRADV